MGIRILEGKKINEADAEAASLYCSTSGRSFGPLFDDADEAEAFLDYCQGIGSDIRKVDHDRIVDLVASFRMAR
jgi:hypothetical protein